MSRWHDQIKNRPEWHAARLECFERDGYACVDCGTDQDLQADHDPVPLWRCLSDEDLAHLAVDVDNLVTRCGPRANGCNQAKGGRYDGGTLVRHEWINPAYPEVLPALQ